MDEQGTEDGRASVIEHSGVGRKAEPAHGRDTPSERDTPVGGGTITKAEKAYWTQMDIEDGKRKIDRVLSQSFAPDEMKQAEKLLDLWIKEIQEDEFAVLWSLGSDFHLPIKALSGRTQSMRENRYRAIEAAKYGDVAVVFEAIADEHADIVSRLSGGGAWCNDC